MALTMARVRQEVGPDTTLVGVIGSPIAHSLTPRLHRAAFDVLGLGDTWRSVAFDVAAGQAGEALEAMREVGIFGLSVTMPLKADVAALVDERSDVAAKLEAVNSVVNRDGVLFGANTDGEGFVASLARRAGFSAAGQRCLVVGAGGAARAVVLALAEAGAAEVAVGNRTASRAGAVAALAGVVGRAVDLSGAPGPEVEALVAQADLVVNATPIGMVGTGGTAAEGEEWPIAPHLLHPGQVVADLIYVPRPTPWLAAAATAGATTVDGLGMLVHQAAAQLAVWTGLDPPVEAMWRSVDPADTATS
jgi:shikimate dehydrogenase